MKKRFLIIPIILVLFSITAPDPGYVQVYYGGWRIETTFWFALISIILSGVLILLLIRFVCLGMDLPKMIRGWFKNRHVIKANKNLQSAFSALIEEQWSVAEKRFTQNIQQSSLPVLHYLGAAIAAHKLEALTRRDYYLTKARTVDPDYFSFPIDILHAKLQKESGQIPAARSTLVQLQTMVPNHSTVLRMLTQIYQSEQDWTALQQILPIIQFNHVFTETQLDQIVLQLYQGLLGPETQKTPTALESTWRSIPRRYQTNRVLIAKYMEGLIAQDQVKAEQFLTQTLKKQGSFQLLPMYLALGQVPIQKRLKSVKALLKSYPNNKQVLNCIQALNQEAEDRLL